MPTIMIVDDQEVSRKALAALFQGQGGYRVIEADDGADALEMARDERPDLAVVDLVMPEMDGFELAHRLRREGGSLARLPIVFISALYLPAEAVELARVCGVRHLLPRDAGRREILAAVKEALEAPATDVSVPPWSEFGMELLRLHADKVSDQMKTVIPALAELGRCVYGSKACDGGGAGGCCGQCY